MTEPDHGSDPGGMETTAEEVDGGFVVNGSKTWISNSPVALVLYSPLRRDIIVDSNVATCLLSGLNASGMTAFVAFFWKRL